MLNLNMCLFLFFFQIWDFQSGRSRDCEESGPEDARCKNGKNGKGGFVSKTKAFQDMYDEMSHSMRCEDTLCRNVSCFP